MYQVGDKNHDKIAFLFEGWEETMIWSFLQGHLGTAWTDDLNHPTMAYINVACFVFIAGNAKSVQAEALIRNCVTQNPFLLLIPHDKNWEKKIQQVFRDQSNCQKITRYAIKKEKNIFKKEKLQAYIEKLSDNYQLMPIDEMIYHKTKETDWCTDFSSQFPTWQDFKKNALGYVIIDTKTGQIASGASTYSYYDEGIEIEVDTHPDFRRQGLATTCSARLILECLNQGKYPSWDAANMYSVRLAEKLGYHFDHEYVTFHIQQNQNENR